MSSTACSVVRGGTNPRATGAPEGFVSMPTATKSRRALPQLGGDSGSRHASGPWLSRWLRTMDIARRINRCRFRCGCVFGLWKEMVAHDQDSIGNPVLPPRIVVGVLDHDGAGQSEQGLGFALAMKVRVIPVQSRGMIIRHGDFIGAHARPARRQLVLGNEIRGEDVVARRNARSAWQRLNLQSVEMQVGVAGEVMIGAGHNIEISRCPRFGYVPVRCSACACSISSRDSRGPKEAPGRSCQNWFWIVQMRPKRPLG